MEIIKIKVSEYYANPYYYSVMPQPVFDALEKAALDSDEFAAVEKVLFDKMIEDYKLKVEESKIPIAQNKNT